MLLLGGGLLCAALLLLAFALRRRPAIVFMPTLTGITAMAAAVYSVAAEPGPLRPLAVSVLVPAIVAGAGVLIATATAIRALRLVASIVFAVGALLVLASTVSY
jgi:hypothetical protein